MGGTSPSGHTDAFDYVMGQIAGLGLREYDGHFAEAVLDYMKWLLSSEETRMDEVLSALPNLFERAKVHGFEPGPEGGIITLAVPPDDMRVWYPQFRDLMTHYLDEVFRRRGGRGIRGVRVVPATKATPLPDSHFEHDRMPFQRKSEVAVYEGLKRMQRARRMLVIPNARVRPPGPYRIPDFVVVIDGKAAAIEVDGTSHDGRRDKDNLRDQYLEDNGLAFVRHISETDAFDADRLARFLDRFVERLEKHRA